MATQFGSLKALLERFEEHRFGPAEVQRLVESWDVLARIGKGELTRDMLSQVIMAINPYTSEKVDVRYFYPRGWKPTKVDEQLAVLQKTYTGLDGSHVVGLAKATPVSADVDGIFVIPKPSSIAAQLGIHDPFGTGYGQLLERGVLTHLGNQRKFYNYRTGQLTPELCRMRQSA
ncbi:MAG TPA: hypothetical protein PLD54_04055, partial [Candidatus Levybacteria bacterium]|nr:hypothetical protein [Candidatus Levybacteria bacterium]